MTPDSGANTALLEESALVSPGAVDVFGGRPPNRRPLASFGLAIVAASSLAGLVSSRHAEAQALPYGECAAGDRCSRADVLWQYRKALFDDVHLDSGWVPASAPLQLRVELFIGGSTEVEMAGTADARWPTAIATGIDALPDAGVLRMNYGLELRVQLRFDIDVAGVRYHWEGTIPVPGIPDDLRMAGETPFGPLLLPPSPDRPAVVEDSTDRVRIFRYDAIGGLISVPGVGGGFELDVAGNLETSYETEQLVVAGWTPINAERARTLVGPDVHGYGAALDFVAHPEGELGYAATITAYPSLYLSIAGRRFDFPLAELPFEVLSRVEDAIFDDETAHLPLPDVHVIAPTGAAPDAELAFTTIAIGESTELTLLVSNDGEAALSIAPEVRWPGAAEVASAFSTDSGPWILPPRSERRMTVAFHPQAAGATRAELVLTTNDPDSPEVTIALAGTGFEAVSADGGFPASDAGTFGAEEAGGCGCRIAGTHRRGPGEGGASFGSAPAAAGLLVLLSLAWRRRRPCARAPRR